MSTGPRDTSALDRLAAHIAPFLAEHARGPTVLAAVSGGADSLALALVLVHAWRRGSLRGVCLGHVDHRMHPASGRAAASVAALGRRLGVPVLSRALDLPVPSSEARLREARYAALADIAAEASATCVLTAHHRDDALETILFRALRGTGPRGLCGIPAVRALDPTRTVLRPFLDVPRATLRAVVAASGEHAVEDPTNLDLRYARNRLRHDLLPRMRRRSGARVDRCLLGVAIAARRVTAQLDAAARALTLRHLRAATPWRCALALPPEATHEEVWRAAVAQALARVGAAHVPWSFVWRAAALRTAAAGTRVHGPRQPLVERTRDALLLIDPARAGVPPPSAVALPLDAGPLRFGTTEWSIGARRSAPEPSPARDRWHALLDAETAPWPWRLRARRAGDRFTPLGMCAPVELRTLAIARAVPRFDRTRLPLVVDASDRILWMPGAEIAAAARVRPDSRSCIALSAICGSFGGG